MTDRVIALLGSIVHVVSRLLALTAREKGHRTRFSMAWLVTKDALMRSKVVFKFQWRDKVQNKIGFLTLT